MGRTCSASAAEPPVVKAISVAAELKLTIDQIWFAGADVALVDGTYMVIGAVDPNGQALPPRKGLLTSVLIKEDGAWHVAASRSMIPIPLPWRPKKQ